MASPARPIAIQKRLQDRPEAIIGPTTNWPAEPPATTDVAVRRWLAAVGPAADDHLALWELRHHAPPAWSATVRRIRERGDPITRGDLAITGEDLQRLGLSGRRIGDALAALLDRVHDDPSLNTRDWLIALARELE